MERSQGSKQYDLEDRTLLFAKRSLKFCKGLPKSVVNGETGRQLIRSATSVGANYIEANEALSKKDFLMRVKICRKEAKEAGYWLKLIEVDGPQLADEQGILLKESTELTKIFGSIVTRSQKP